MNQFRYYLVVLFICLLSTNWADAQPQMQHIHIQDRVLRQNLEDFVRQSKARWVKIVVEQDSVDKGYVYYVYTVRDYDTVRAYDGDVWGEWQHTILLFYTYGTVDLGAVYQLADTTNQIQMQHYARLSLPKLEREPVVPYTRSRSVLRQNLLKNIKYPKVIISRNNDHSRAYLVYTFKEVNGREVYFSDNINGDHNLIELNRFPPVPEQN